MHEDLQVTVVVRSGDAPDEATLRGEVIGGGRDVCAVGDDLGRVDQRSARNDDLRGRTREIEDATKRPVGGHHRGDGGEQMRMVDAWCRDGAGHGCPVGHSHGREGTGGVDGLCGLSGHRGRRGVSGAPGVPGAPCPRGDLLGCGGDIGQFRPGEQVLRPDAVPAVTQASGGGERTDAVATEADEVPVQR